MPEVSAMRVCTECAKNAVPPGREKFCSPDCAARYKRRKTRETRTGQHRHDWACRACGKRYKPGRRMIPDEVPPKAMRTGKAS